MNDSGNYGADYLASRLRGLAYLMDSNNPDRHTLNAAAEELEYLQAAVMRASELLDRWANSLHAFLNTLSDTMNLGLSSEIISYIANEWCNDDQEACHE